MSNDLLKPTLLIPILLLGCGQKEEPGQMATPPSASKAKSVNIDIHPNLSYVDDNDARHTLDLLLPKGKKGEPLLIFIHGGAWLGGAKDPYFPYGLRFANKGIAVAVINYRLTPMVKNPEHVKDAAKAYAWLAQNAEKYGYDPRRIFVSGHSAGAHNAGMMATGTFLQDAKVSAQDMPAGFIGFEGIYDLADLNHKFPTYKNWFLAPAFGEENLWAAASPSRRSVVLKAPWLVVQSTTDQLVDVGQAEKFAQHLKSAGVKVALYKEDMGKHDQVMTDAEIPASKLSAEVERFVNAKGE